jgi:hypothetical protein
MFDGFEVKALPDITFPNPLLVAANCAVSILSPESDLSPQRPRSQKLKSETWATRPKSPFPGNVPLDGKAPYPVRQRPRIV